MFLYRVEYTESEYDIQNNDLLYKIGPKHQNTFDFLEKYPVVHRRRCRRPLSVHPSRRRRRPSSVRPSKPVLRPVVRRVVVVRPLSVRAVA